MADPTDQGLVPIWTTQFSTILELKLQQMGSVLRPTIAEGTHVGKMASPVQQLSAIVAKAPQGRFQPKQHTSNNFTRRWVFPLEREIDQLIDTFDELQTIVDPKSKYAEGAAMAIGRAWDDVIIAAAFGTAQTGQDASNLTPEVFNPGGLASTAGGFQVVDNFATGGGSANGLTIAKLIEAKRVFRHNHVDLDNDPLTLVIGSQQESDLLNQVQVVSTEFNDRPVLVDGRVTRFLGFDIKVMERLPLASNGTDRECLTYCKSGLYLGLWQDLFNRVSIRNDLSSEPYDLYTKTMFGATRTQPGKVLQILCADSTGSDITP